MQSTEETMKKLKDSLNRTTITAPVDGVVKKFIFCNRGGGVIKPGEAILDLVPTKDSLIVEARLPNSDIGFVKPGSRGCGKTVFSKMLLILAKLMVKFMTELVLIQKQDENDKQNCIL